MSEMNQWSAGEQKKKVIETHHYFVKYEDKETIDINAGNFSYVLGYSDKDVKLLFGLTDEEVNYLLS